MNVCKLVIKEDSKNSINKKILSYINKNMETLIFDKQLIFEFHCIKKKQKYQGISKCPTLVVDGKRYTGEEILDFFRKPTISERRPQKLNPRAELSDYFDNMLLSPEDMDQDVSELHHQKLAEMTQGRIPSNGRKGDRIPGRFDHLIQKISAGNSSGGVAEQVDDFGVDDDFRADYEGADGANFGAAPSGDFDNYAKSLIGGGSGIMA